MSEINKQIALALADEVWNKGRLDRINELVDEDFTFQHPDMVETVRGRDGFAELVKAYRTAFPDLKLSVDAMLADGDQVAWRWIAKGTHQNDLRSASINAPATYRLVQWTGMDIVTIREGRVSSISMISDAIGLCLQLGLVMDQREVFVPTGF